MKEILHHYLIQQGQVALPGIGSLQLHRRPAHYDVVDQRMWPPVSEIVLENRLDTPSRHQISWVASQIGLGDAEALERMEQETRRWISEDAGAGIVAWPDGSVLRKLASGQWQWESASGDWNSLPPIAAKKIIRQEVTHQVLTGDREIEHTLVNGEEVFPEESLAARRWWFWPWIILLACLVGLSLFFWHYKGLGNRNKVNPAETTKTYSVS